LALVVVVGVYPDAVLVAVGAGVGVGAGVVAVVVDVVVDVMVLAAALGLLPKGWNVAGYPPIVRRPAKGLFPYPELVPG
jgi:hypothetical protein